MTIFEHNTGLDKEVIHKIQVCLGKFRTIKKLFFMGLEQKVIFVKDLI